MSQHKDDGRPGNADPGRPGGGPPIARELPEELVPPGMVV